VPIFFPAKKYKSGQGGIRKQLTLNR